MSLNVSVGEMSTGERNVLTMGMKATESILAGCAKAGCANADEQKTQLSLPPLKAHEEVQLGSNSVNFSTPCRSRVNT